MKIPSDRDRDEWRPDDEYPYQPPSNGRPPRRSRRKPSLLDALKEEETVSETMAMPPVKIEAAPAPAPKLELTPRKRRKAPEPAASKKRRLMKTAEHFAKNAREKRSTMKWHKCCRQNISARPKVPRPPGGFRVVDYREEPHPARGRSHQRQHEDVLRQVLGDREQAQRAAGTQVAVPLADEARAAAAEQVPPPTLQRDARPAQGTCQGAGVARTRSEEHRGVRSHCSPEKGCTCKKIFHASVLNEGGERCLMASRNKTLAVCMIINPGISFCLCGDLVLKMF